MTVTLTQCRADHGKPPSVTYSLDLRLANEADEPRWFLVGGKPGAQLPARVDALETMQFLNPPTGAYLQAYGEPDGFLAFRLAGGASLSLDGLEMTSFEPAAALDVWTSPTVLADGAPLEGLVPEDVTLETSLVVVDAANTRVGPDYEASGGHTLVVEAAERTTLTLPSA